MTRRAGIGGYIERAAARIRRPRRPATTGLLIEYSPRMDGDPDPGEVVWTWVPYEDDPTQGKDRPVVVVGHRDGELVGVPLTSKRDERDPQVAVGTGAWDSQRRPSYARIDRLLTIDPDRMRREGSILERARFDDVAVAVQRRHARPSATRRSD